MPHTLSLSDAWDIGVDDSGDIATVTGPYAIAQNVANAVRLFTQDAYFNADKGIPHFEIELGHLPPMPVLRTRILGAALGVPGVADASANFDSYTDRILSGEILITTTDGERVNVEF